MKLVIWTLAFVGLVAGGIVGYVMTRPPSDEERDEQIRRRNDETLSFPKDLDCKKGLGPPLHYALNRSTFADTLVEVEGDTVKFDMDVSCDHDMLNLVFRDWRVNRLLKRCAIKHLVCDDYRGKSLDVTW